MKFSRLLLVPALLATLVIGGCDDDGPVRPIDEAPQPPQGVYSVTGDNAVYLYWYGPYDDDINQFIVWRSNDPVDNYVEIGRRTAVDNPDMDLLIYDYVDYTAFNGDTWFYAISSVDYAGQHSALSAEDVFDTPRPEGESRLWDPNVDPGRAGFSFILGGSVQWDSPAADVFLVKDPGTGVFFLTEGVDVFTDFQDMGFTNPDFSDIGWAPQEGWSAFIDIEIIEGHTYVFLTIDGNYAKMRAMDIDFNSIVFQWAYQTVEGLPELAPLDDGSNELTLDVNNEAGSAQ